ncbi:MAG: DUF4954 family protein [Candidatus Sabulitectum sp.]|nr:DUF4954 family protein [Candidatus Sabulitectum sp.]
MWLHGPGEKGGTELIDLSRIAELAEELLIHKDSLNCTTAVSLNSSQIQKLKAQGCSSSKWDLVKFTSESDLSLVVNCSFQGSVNVHLPAGILVYTSFENCNIEGPLTVRSTRDISSMTLLPGAKVEYCGSIQWDSSPGVMGAFMNAGVETGERQVPILPHFDHNDVAFLGSASGRKFIEECILLRNGIREKLKGVIGRNAVVTNCSCIYNSLILEKVLVKNASAVRGSILFGGASAVDGALIRNSVLQWNSSVDSFAIVENSIAGECAVVERHGKLTDSFLGADSVLGEGEVTASVVGPLTGIHHQSLLIAAMWPGGRGNIGYGANVGSNHTSRLPDQEIKPGTGQFFGLSTSVKFPADFSRSPFTIIATGLTTLPQRVSFPFSLITLPHKRPQGVPEGWNRLIPGWMLSENLYSVLRNSWKYRKRLKAVHTSVDTSVFSDEVLLMVKDAWERLEQNSCESMPGAGKNFITEDDRVKGIEVFRKCLRSMELWKKYLDGSLNDSETGEMLDLLRYVRSAAISSRMKDYTRGERIIDDYMAVRGALEEDEFIQTLEAYCKKIIEQLDSANGSRRVN